MNAVEKPTYNITPEFVARFAKIAGDEKSGMTRRECLPKVMDPVALDLMRTLKHALDPKGIINPGKVL